MNVGMPLLICFFAVLLLYLAAPKCFFRVPGNPLLLRWGGFGLLVLDVLLWAGRLHPAAAILVTSNLSMLLLGLLPWLALLLARHRRGQG